MAVRDRWIGWSLQQKLRRLHLIAQNVRFVILSAAAGGKNLASRVLGLGLRRLSGDILAEYGYPALLPETFVDQALHRGTCYRRELAAAGVHQRLCPSEGPPMARWRHDGRPKQVPVYHWHRVPDMGVASDVQIVVPGSRFVEVEVRDASQSCQATGLAAPSCIRLAPRLTEGSKSNCRLRCHAKMYLQSSWSKNF